MYAGTSSGILPLSLADLISREPGCRERETAEGTARLISDRTGETYLQRVASLWGKGTWSDRHCWSQYGIASRRGDVK